MTIPDPIKSGVSTSVLVFIISFFPALFGWLGQLAEWASSSGAKPLPGISALGYAAVSAILAVAGGVLMGVFRWAQGRYKIVPGQPPTFGA